jgi:hypothetical protein
VADVEKIFRLGRKCILEIDGEPCDSVADVLVRERTETLDVTGLGQTVVSEIPVTRTYQIVVTFSELTVARQLWTDRLEQVGDFLLPRIFTLLVEGATMTFQERFVVADIDDDQPIDGAVQPRIQFNQWGHQAA